MTHSRHSDSRITADLVEENRTWLRQLSQLLEAVSAESYTAAEGPFRRGGAGKHVRHVLEFYQGLLNGLPLKVDYDARVREQALETDPAAARERIHVLLQALSDLERDMGTGAASNPSREVLYRVNGTCCHSIYSTLDRELLFLSSHTVHHLALIKFILEYQGITVPDELGVAPSTLQHERDQNR